jgi:methionyl-tRNA formyltransferase
VVILNEIARKRKLLGRRFLRRRGIVNYLDLLFLVSWSKSSAKAKAIIKKVLPKNVISLMTAAERNFDHSRPSSFSSVLRQLDRESKNDAGITYVDFARINAPEAINSIKKLRLDRLMTCGAPLLGKQFIQNLTPILNTHCGITPKYRGSSPIHWAIYNRDFGNIGYTIHMVSPDVDGGKVIMQKKVKPNPQWSLTDIEWYLMRTMYLDLIEVISSDDFSQILAQAASQDLSKDSWPPMGYFRTKLAQRNLMGVLAVFFNSQGVTP